MIRTLAAALSLIAAPSWAEAPQVVTDIAPIQSLVAQVMDGVGTPDLIVPPGADAHHLALRPSDARKLSRANVVVWAGPALTPWLADPVATLAPTAATLTLLGTAGWAHRDPTGHHDHGSESADMPAEHDIDPHAWLDPEVAMVWVRAIRNTLVTTDPDNATQYTANADLALANLMSLHDRIAAELADTPAGTWIAPHAAFGYFTDRYNIAAAGAISDSDAQAPGPAHLAELQAQVQNGSVTCVMSETNGPTDYADLLIEGTDARQGTIDDTGIALTPGPGLYAELLTGIATSLKDCIAP